MAEKIKIIELDEIVNEYSTNIDKTESLISRLTNIVQSKEYDQYYDKCPVIYIHGYTDRYGNNKVYVGESTDIISRTIQHYDKRKDKKEWQSKLFKNGRTIKMYVIGHNRFNKSLTLDIENSLIQYISVANRTQIMNYRYNPQYQYYTKSYFYDLLNNIWEELRKNKEVTYFLPLTEIKDSAIYKASPFHQLKKEQIETKNQILLTINKALRKNQTGQLVLITGSAGTGKTVLMSNIFYNLCCGKSISNEEDGNVLYENLDCCFVVNHKEQYNLFKQIALRLNIRNDKGRIRVYKPTNFINETKKNKKKYDIVFIDEGHLLLTQSDRGYYGKSHLDDIMKIAKVTVFVYDENQVLSKKSILEYGILEKYEKMASYKYELTEQLRMDASKETVDWIRNITQKNEITKLNKDENGYIVKCVDSLEKLEKIIVRYSKKEESKLSRMVATYDWDYKPGDEGYWEVKIGDFVRPWNYQIQKKKHINSKELKENAWAEQKHTIGEIGSTYTIQGFDLSYVGVIIGPSVIYRDNKVVFVGENSKNKQFKDKRKLQDNSFKSFAETLLKNELNVLLTRGVKGLYIYAVDDELRKALMDATN